MIRPSSIAHLRKAAANPAAPASMRGTDAQDVARTPDMSLWGRWRWPALLGAGGMVLIVLIAWLLQAWSHSRYSISAERLRLASVERGHFVRDVSADGVVIAPVSPTLFAIATGTVSYAVHAGDRVRKGQALATIDSPELRNQALREQTTLDSLDAALSRQQIEIRRQLLTSQQQADLAQVAIRAAERELKREQWAWDLRAIPERDYQRALDDLQNAKLNFEHARDTATLERDSVALDLRTKRLERDRQSLIVADLKRRVNDLTVRSPVDGQVANLAQQEKAQVPENAPLLTVVDLTALEVEFRVTETYASDIKSGLPADITLGGRTERGTVTAISPEVRDNEVIGRVRFSAGQPPGLRQNERAALRIVLDDRDNVLKFERGPLIDEATRAVYLLRGDHAVRVPVELGPASVSEIQVLRGLTAGDQVVVSDTRDFHDAPELLIAR